MDLLNQHTFPALGLERSTENRFLRLESKGVQLASSLTCPNSVGQDWSLPALRGRVIEISGAADTAALTVCAALILQAQQEGGLAAWVTGWESIFYPPDFAASGIDLKALPVVRVADSLKGAHAADTLIRSGAFAVVVLDSGRMLDLSFSVQTRLVGLAKKHQAALLVVTRQLRSNTVPSSLASLRAETQKQRGKRGFFLCEVCAVKDKRRVAGWNHTEVCRGPDGLY